MSVSGETLKQSLTERLAPLPDCFSELHNAARTVSGITHHRVDLPWSHEILDQAYAHWLAEQTESLSLKYQGNTSKKIEVKDLSPALQSVDAISGYLRFQLSDERISLEQAVKEFLADVPFAKLAEELNTKAMKLESAGYTEAAKFIAEQLRCKARNNQHHLPTRTKRHYLFEYPLHISMAEFYDHTMPRTLRQLAECFRLVEQDAGRSGLAASIDKIAQSFSDALSLFPSRTVLAEGMPIEGVVFKEHMKIRMSHDVADAVFAFIRIYSDIELYDFVAKAAS